MIYIHGGPEGQFRPSFNPTIQMWVEKLGVAVVAPNVRGSLGYGEVYLEMDDGRLREHAVTVDEPEALGEALDALESDEIIKSAMPDEMYRVFMHYKGDEWEKFNHTVTEWDLQTYWDCLP